MGQAKRRKQNGTYPIFINAEDLKLVDVPERARKEVRALLAPIVGNIPLRNGDCWSIAQKLMLAASNPRVGYVEGVWTHLPHCFEHLRGDCDCEEYNEFAVPHAWNI